MVAIGVGETEIGAQLITRSEWRSLTKTVFPTEVATPTGWFRVAVAALPPVDPATPVPHTVDTRPAGVTARTRLFPVSLTKIVLVSVLKDACDGEKKDAATPKPSEKLEEPLPARLVTTPLIVNWRILFED